MSKASVLNSLLLELIDEKAVVFKNPDYMDSIIGFTADGTRVIYSYDLMVRELMETEKMEEDEAVDWIEYNTLGALRDAEYQPIVMRSLEEL